MASRKKSKKGSGKIRNLKPRNPADERVKGGDSLTDMSSADSLQLQAYMSRKATLDTALSNVLTSSANTAGTIISKLK